MKRRILRDLVAAQEIADPAARDAALIAARAEIPSGSQLIERAWAAVTGYAFLEYTLVYVYNDYESYQTFGNEHEGDVEGFCLVFERAMLDEFADGARAAKEVLPHTIITAAHEELNDTDDLKRLPLELAEIRKDLLVRVAVGSHASYLTPGPHDVTDFEDFLTDYPGKLPGWALPLLPAILPILLLMAIGEHFVDIEDETSDEGGAVGGTGLHPGPIPFDDMRVDVLPLSNIAGGEGFDNIYQDSHRRTLAPRAFPGLWGAHAGFIDHSSRWENMTARFFRIFLDRGDIPTPPVIL